MIKLYQHLFSVVILFFCLFAQAQEEGIKIIDNKGTLKNINKVFAQNATPTPVSKNMEGDIWYDTSGTNTVIKIWDDNMDTTTSTPGWRSLASDNWLLTGNSNATTSNFLGTINDVRMQIRSNNTPILEFGRRATLELVQPYVDYTDPNQYLVYLNGDDNGVSALQFRADGASFYKPMFFTTANGSFRLKGSSGRTDLFELGSAGPDNDGRLEFIVGDDGTEPIVFKRYDYRSGRFYREFFRVQGSNNTVNAKTRFGININQNNYSFAGNINAPSNGGSPAKAMANSTLQIKGSVSKSIIEITSGTGNFNLTEDHHTIIVKTNRNIILPNANTCEGRIYVIKNISGNLINTSTYRDELNINLTTIINNRTIWLQSNGTEWNLISSTSMPPIIKATGKIKSDGDAYRIYNATSTKTGTGNYTIQLPVGLVSNKNYTIQLTVYDNNNSTTVPVISYYEQETTSFKVLIENTFGTDVDYQFSFTVIDW